MTDPITAFRTAHALDVPAASPGSRYAAVGTGIFTTSDGRDISYLLRRFPSDPAHLATIGFATVTEGDRPDLLAHRHLGDSTSWWRIADAHLLFDPAQLTAEPGSLIRLTLPEGILGPSDD